MESYTHFTLSERISLLNMHREGKSNAFIAKQLNKHRSSIGRELKRNYNRRRHQYTPAGATRMYLARRTRCRKQLKIKRGSKLYLFIIDCLNKYWSPEIIANACAEEGFSVSYSTIYSAIKNGLLEGISRKTHLRRRGRRRLSNRSKFSSIKVELTIHDRPDIINSKERVGDFEGDTIVGAKRKSALVTMVDRRSKILLVKKITASNSEEVKIALISMMQKTALPVHSITLDNGAEFAQYKKVEDELGCQIYFCDPSAPWQRGLNENTNGILRFFFPKGTDFNEITDAEIQSVVDLINNRPRKCLGFLSPIDFLSKKCCT